jgi:hypothetical protein
MTYENEKRLQAAGMLAHVSLAVALVIAGIFYPAVAFGIALVVALVAAGVLVYNVVAVLWALVRQVITGREW